jgi:transposase-like protein
LCEAFKPAFPRWLSPQARSARYDCSSKKRDAGKRIGLTADGRTRLKAPEKENRELKKANEILRLASAFFAQAELDRLK